MAYARQRAHHNEPPVLILGSGRKALSLMRCLGKAGIKCYLAFAAQGYEQRSRWYNALPRGVSHLGEGQDLESWLLKLPFERAVLMPCTDRWALQVAALPGALRERFAASVAPRSVQELILDQSRFCEFLRRYDLPHARTIYPCTEKTIKGMGSRALRRYFLKPRNTETFQASFGASAFLPDSLDDYLAQIEILEKAGHEVMLQHFIPGGPTNHYFIEGFVDRFGQAHATFARQCLRMDKGDFGRSTAVVSIALHRVYPAVQSVLRLLKAIDYRGVYSVEFKFDSRDGVFKLIKMKGRPWRCIEAALACGINIPALAYADALRRDIKADRSAYKTGVKCIDLLADFALWRNARESRDFSWRRMLLDWTSANPALLRLADPLPWLSWLCSNYRSRQKLSRAAAGSKDELRAPSSKLLISKETSLAGTG